MISSNQMLKIMQDISDEIRETYKFRWVVFSFVSSTLKMRYRRSFLGFAWSLLGPMLNYLVMGIVISKVGRFSTTEYLAHMLLGSASFNFINTGFMLGGNSLIGNESYIRKIYLPKLVFPLSAIGMEGVNFILGLISLLVILLFLGGIHLHWSFFWLPISIIILALFTLGVGMILSVLFVFFRDLNHVVPIIMQVAFFGTPIIYPESSIPAEYLEYLKYNPLNYIIDFVRHPFIKGDLPNILTMLIAICLAISVFLIGLFIIKKYDNRIIFKL
jgi:ABC-type polysaccharide/polyol phosphate export permease